MLASLIILLVFVKLIDSAKMFNNVRIFLKGGIPPSSTQINIIAKNVKKHGGSLVESIIDATHLVLLKDKPFTSYNSLIKSINIEKLPENVKLVHEDWLSNCLGNELWIPENKFEVRFNEPNETMPPTKKMKLNEIIYNDTTNSDSNNELLIYNEDINIKEKINYDSWQFTHDKSCMFKLHSKQKLRLNSDNEVEMIGIDMDSTIIVTKSGKKHAIDFDDWKFFDDNVPNILQNNFNNGKYLVIISNQGGIKNDEMIQRLQNKIDNIIASLGVPIDYICSFKHNIYRKPMPGMWDLICQLRSLRISVNDDQFIKLNITKSLYIGDAANRPANAKSIKVNKDFSDTDLKFALNINVPFTTPEVFFKKSTFIDDNTFNINENSMKLINYNRNDDYNNALTSDKGLFQKEILLLVSPCAAAGKSTFAREYVVKNPNYIRINQDILLNLNKCISQTKIALNENCSVLIDNINHTKDIRKKWINLANELNVPIRCIVFDTPKSLAMTLREFRSTIFPLLRLPAEENRNLKIEDVVIHTQFKYYIPPDKDEGFYDISNIKWSPNVNFFQNNPNLLRVFYCYIV